MPRPKGSKNKPKTNELVEFNYEDESSQTYTPEMMPAPSQQMTNNVEFDYAEDEGVHMPTTMSAQLARPTSDNSANLYLITGKVRMDRAGQDPIIADQQRIVYAHNFNEAVAKYTAYFSSLNNQNERYTVVGASVSEAIR